MPKAVLVVIFSVFCTISFAKESTVVIPDKAGDFKNGIYHIGLLVDDIDVMVDFLAKYSSLKPISRVRLPTGGERLFLQDARGQRLELFSKPKNVQPRHQYSENPHADYSGMAHIAIEVDDVVEIKEKVLEEHYAIIFQAPNDFSEGYIVSEVDAHRVLFIRGPSDVSFEFFEIKKD